MSSKLPEVLMDHDLFFLFSVETKVFVFASAIEADPLMLEVLRAVCKDWRTIIDLSPVCNQHLDFSCFYWDGGVETVLELRKLGRRVRRQINRHPSLLLDFRVSVTICSYWDPCHLFVHALEGQELYFLCSAVAGRTRSINVGGTPRVLESLFRWSWPQLEELRLQFDEDPYLAIMHPSSPQDPASFDAPVLARLSSNYFTRSVLAFLPQPSHISHLEIFRPAVGVEEAPLSLFLLVAASFPSLRHLSIALDDIVDPFPTGSFPVCFPLLETLHLSSSRPCSDSGWHSNWVNSTLWAHFIAPTLRDFAVPLRWFTMGAIRDLGQFFDRNGQLPSIVTFVECPRAFAEAWRDRHQAAWPTVLVRVREISHPKKKKKST
ncbi:hypothetical protein K438DRAFT_1973355 [Mycena galopus ATCC 62051]|nr:hypothetical protein K438DRAFT_1973355 [Mycena galopus ATCC 62051]